MTSTINVEFFDDINLDKLDLDNEPVRFFIYTVASMIRDEFKKSLISISEDHMKIIGICNKEDAIKCCNRLVAYFLSEMEECGDCQYMIFDPFLKDSGYITLYNQNTDAIESYSVTDTIIIDKEDAIALTCSIPLSLIETIDRKDNDNEHSESRSTICH